MTDSEAFRQEEQEKLVKRRAEMERYASPIPSPSLACRRVTRSALEQTRTGARFMDLTDVRRRPQGRDVLDPACKADEVSLRSLTS